MTSLPEKLITLADQLQNNRYAPYRDALREAAAALTAAEAAGMVWVPKETLEAAERTLAHFVTDKSGSLMGLRAALSARPSLTGPEQATREGDATP